MDEKNAHSKSDPKDSGTRAKAAKRDGKGENYPLTSAPGMGRVEGEKSTKIIVVSTYKHSREAHNIMLNHSWGVPNMRDEGFNRGNGANHAFCDCETPTYSSFFFSRRHKSRKIWSLLLPSPFIARVISTDAICHPKTATFSHLTSSLVMPRFPPTALTTDTFPRTLEHLLSPTRQSTFQQGNISSNRYGITIYTTYSADFPPTSECCLKKRLPTFACAHLYSSGYKVADTTLAHI